MAKTTLGQIGKTLEDLPRGPGAYKQAYEKTIVRIRGQPSEHKQLARRTLRWLACAARQIGALELRHALAIRDDSSSLPSEEDLESTNFVVKVCMGLVIVEREAGIIRLLHHTALEFLQQNMNCLWSLEDSETLKTCLPPPKSSKCAMREIHQDIAKTCIKYLSFEDIQRSLVVDVDMYHESCKYPFMEYTVQHWDHHWRKGFNEARLPVSMFQIITAFLETKLACTLMSDRMPISIFSLGKLTMLHFVAAFGLTSMIDVCLNNGHDIHATTERGENALWFALLCREEETSKALLQKGAKEVFVEILERRVYSSLSLAIANGMRVAADLLLDDNFGARINPETNVYEGAWDGDRSYTFIPPLILAVQRGNLNMTKMLLDHGADPLAKYDSGFIFTESHRVDGTALIEAARGGHEDIVEALLQALGYPNKEMVYSKHTTTPRWEIVRGRHRLRSKDASKRQRFH